jgi:hypothetical protein
VGEDLANPGSSLHFQSSHFNNQVRVPGGVGEDLANPGSSLHFQSSHFSNQVRVPGGAGGWGGGGMQPVDFSLQVKMNVRHCCFFLGESAPVADVPGGGRGRRRRRWPGAGQERAQQAGGRRSQEEGGRRRGARILPGPAGRVGGWRSDGQVRRTHLCFRFRLDQNCHGLVAVFRIRIHFIRIQIRFQHFRLNTDPDPIRIYNLPIPRSP